MRETLPPLYPTEAPLHKTLFFASDLHAGAPSRSASAPRERHFIRWMETMAPEAAAFYLLGDLWDFWFEYRRAVPKGHVRLLGVLATVTDAGIPVFFQPGNHDLWLTGYLTEEVGLRRLPDPYLAMGQGFRFFLSHGHRLGPLPWTDRLAYWIMGNRFLHQLYRGIHPDIGLWLGQKLSGRSRSAHAPLDDVDLGEREYFRQFIRGALAQGAAADWYILAHRHLALVEQIGQSQVVLLGDWIRRFTYFRLEEAGWSLESFSSSGESCILYHGSWAPVPLG
ncbi:MAG: UDP-2,3-diacylglucosamine diphosphatase [Bacteroidia bacterium]|nr:UDP-2,3-diacylglucosamine diphosphatase [Bacteroidia bacterium]